MNLDHIIHRRPIQEAVEEIARREQAARDVPSMETAEALRRARLLLEEKLAAAANPDLDDVIPLADYARLMHCSVPAARKRAQRGSIPIIKRGGRLFVKLAS